MSPLLNICLLRLEIITNNMIHLHILIKMIELIENQYALGEPSSLVRAGYLLANS